MNIAIIEKGHFEVTYTLLQLFDNGGNSIIVFAEENSYYQLQLMLPEKASRYTWVIQEKYEPNRPYIARIFHHLQQNPADLIYFNTIEDNFIVYAHYLRKLKNKNIVLTLHDINGFFHYKPSLSIRRLVRYIGKKKLINSIPAFNVLSDTLIHHLRSVLPPPKKIFNIPGSFFDPGQFAPISFLPGETISITIPGSIDTRRRNYELVFDLLHAAQQQGIRIFITLLGAFQTGYSERIQQKCNDYLKTNNNLRIYQSPIVDQPEFDSVIRKSHFIWIPLQAFSSIADGIREQYGVTTCSGNIADIIRHAKPFFAPEQLPLETCLEKSCCRYATPNDILNQLTLLSSGKYDHMQELSRQASLYYTKENIIERNKQLFM